MVRKGEAGCERRRHKGRRDRWMHAWGGDASVSHTGHQAHKHVSPSCA